MLRIIAAFESRERRGRENPASIEPDEGLMIHSPAECGDGRGVEVMMLQQGRARGYTLHAGTSYLLRPEDALQLVRQGVAMLPRGARRS